MTVQCGHCGQTMSINRAPKHISSKHGKGAKA